MANILGIIAGWLFGKNTGASAANVTAGIANLGVLATFGIWIWNHRDGMVAFQCSIGTLALFGAILVVLLEFNRRSAPGSA